MFCTQCSRLMLFGIMQPMLMPMLLLVMILVSTQTHTIKQTHS
jgi:hypothetical protein